MKNVLFVCVENSCRSQMAEAFGRMLGDGVINACSSGSNPSGVVNPKAIAAMREIGYDLSAHDSKSLDDIPDIEYDVVVTMGCGDACPFLPAKRTVESAAHAKHRKQTDAVGQGQKPHGRKAC